MSIEETLLRDVVANSGDARARFLAAYLRPMLKIWELKRPKSASAELSSDFVHWFLVEWIARPGDSYGNLNRFIEKIPIQDESQFLAWWSSTARHRYTDFYREKIRSRYEQRAMADDAGELDAIRERDPRHPERSMIMGDALVALGECFDNFLGRSEVRIEGRLFGSLCLARPGASPNELLETLHKLGFEVKEGELATRKGRVGAQIRGAATLIGRCLSSRGFTTDEVREALPDFVGNIQSRGSE